MESKRTSPLITEAESKKLIDLIDKATLNFSGNLNHLETAIGALIIGRHLGWKPLLLIHDKKTIRRFEKDLEIESIRDYMDAEGINADKSNAWRLVKKISSYWKAVRGEVTGIRTNKAE